MKPISQAAMKAARHRSFHWCRRANGFSDMPLWRLVAAELSMPLYQVLAFVNRLEEAANAAEPRGFVGDFLAAEFGAALGMSAADAERIYLSLERPEIGWIDRDHIVSFYARNPDREDNTNAQRQQRWRDRRKAMKLVAARARAGEISAAERMAIEQHVCSREWDGSLLPAPGRNGVTSRYEVTVTPEQSRIVTHAATDPARGAEEGSPGQQAEAAGPTPEQWLATSGQDYVRGRLDVVAKVADAKLKRWLGNVGGDPAALVEIIQWAVATTDVDRPSHFEAVIGDQIRRRRDAAKGPPLPFAPVIQARQGGLS
jgi:hypothetical protein